MAHSSWGPGWPNCQGATINKNFGVDTVQGRVTFPGGVRHELAELVTRLVQETAKRGYKFGVDGNPSYGCWGYNCRAISGTKKASNHSWGLAIDINAPRNPYKSPLTTDMPPWMRDLWKSYGFRWGGDYSVKQDAMHYEFMGSVTDAKNETAKARNANLGGTTAPPVQPPAGGNPPPPTTVGSLLWPLLTTSTRGAFPTHTSIVQQVTGAKVDGDYYNATADAVKGYQKAYGLGADGKTGQITGTLINQNILRDMGFYGGALDGDYGPGTTRAVYDFQIWCRGWGSTDISADGIIGDITTSYIWFWMPK